MLGFIIGFVVGFIISGLLVRKTWVGKLFGKIGDEAQVLAKDAGALAKKL